MIGGYLIFISTAWGPWAFSDSAAYISAARNIQNSLGPVIINANGSITAVTEFPPVFPFILSLITPFNGDFIQSARWFNIFCFITSIFLSGLISLNLLKKRFLSVIISSAMAISPIMVDTYSGFMSEPLFILFLLLLIFCLLKFLQTRKIIFLFIIFCVVPFLPMIRYAGILFIICVGLLLLAYQKFHIVNLAKIIPVYFIAALLPIMVWFIYQYKTLEKFGGKGFSFDFSLIKNLFRSIFEELAIMLNWIPYSGNYSNEYIKYIFIFIFLILYLFVTIITVISLYKKSHKNNSAVLLLQICLFLISSYLLFIGFTQSVTVPQIDIIDRMLAPIFPFLILFVFSGFDYIIPKSNFSLLTVFSIFLTVLSLRYYFLLSLGQVNTLHKDGLGYTSKEIVQSEFITKLGEIPPDTHLVSNDAAFVLFHSNRFPLPVKQFHNRPFGSGDAYGEKSFRKNHAALIIIYPEFRNYYGDQSTELLKTLTEDLVIAYQDEIGGIYYFPY